MRLPASWPAMFSGQTSVAAKTEAVKLQLAEVCQMDQAELGQL